MESPEIPDRYSAIQQFLHWLTVALILIALPLAWIGVCLGVALAPYMMSEMNGPPSPGARLQEALFTAHKTAGIILLAVVVARLAVIRRQSSLRLHPRQDSLVPRFTHGLLYATLVVMACSGYTYSAASGHPVAIFGLLEVLRLIPLSESWARAALKVHLTSQWLLYALLLLHLAGVGYHVFLRRDGRLGRMLPLQR